MSPQNIESLAKSILDESFGYASVDPLLAEIVEDATSRLFESLDHIHHGWTFTRKGEAAADVGLLNQDGRGIKLCFHSTHDLPLYVGNRPLSPQQKECLKVLDRCRRQLEEIAINLAGHLEVALEMVDLMQRVIDATRIADPYNVSTLRSLIYQDLPGQKGASPRFGRSFLNLHLSDNGGDLFIETAPDTWERASPPKGSLLVIPGAKALELTGGRIKPVRHKATTIRGRTRKAAVLFVHADVGHPVPDAQAEYERFRATRGR